MHSRAIRNLLVGLGILGFSYLAAGLTNAATISQPRLTSNFTPGPVVIVVEPEKPEPSESVRTIAPEPARTLSAL